MKRFATTALLALVSVWAAPVWADDTGLTDMVEIMREEGVINDSQYEQMHSKAARREAKKHWTDRLTFSGDLRVRYEAFVYGTDALGDGRPSRQRARYRVRLQGVADINDHVDAVFRIATGEDDIRSTNQSFGKGLDFDPDSIFMDRGYLVLTPWANGALPHGESGYLGVEVGKMGNPYHWSKSISPDYMLWDRDINLEGGQLKTHWDAAEAVQIFLNTGYYVVDEKSTGHDPGLFAAQIGTHVKALEDVEVGGRFTYYGFNQVDSSFLTRTSMLANTTSGGLFGLTDGSWINVVEGSAYLAISCLEDWPISLFGNVSSNLSAQNLGFGTQDLGWLVGFQAGDKKKWVNAGFLYGEVEADFFPTQFIDSDFTDGATNRQGLSFWFTRQILSNTDLKVETFYGKELETLSPLFDASTADARRWRVRADVQVKF